ncbi:hypothetical protein L7F22_035814 [Adiantum nelumboides]|nr:hypothetical protein [Adiantum nelumboides]
MISHHKSTPYYPQANGQAESTNKTLISVLTKTVEAHRTDWDLKLTSALWAYRTAYKVAINCTPFKMVYGQEAVMPWEFVIPSLRVASQEGWDGNPLVERLYILKRLEEERQLAVYNALIEKDRRKKWFDHHLKDKDIKVGDKVLMYGVRNEKKKLKYAGKGPYRVCEITPQGTIRVETLDGIETVGFLNGSKFKRYYDPLSQEKLQEMHKKREAKKQAELKKIQAQIEARERQERIKRQREANLGIAHALQVETDDNSIQCDPPLRYPIELNSPYGNVLYNALLDSGARHNLLSYGVWCQIGKPPLSHSTIQVKGINKKRTTVFGILQTPIVYDKGTVDQTFLVMPSGTMEGNINLGRQWMVATKCIIDWGTGSIMTHKPTQSVVTQEIISESELPKKMQDNATTQIKYQKTSLSTAQPLKLSPTWLKKYPVITKSIPYTTKGTYQWVPKASLTTPIPRSQTPHTKSFARLKKHNVTKRWVPKHILQAQGYYDGNDKIWIPKGKTYLSMSSTKLRGSDTVTSLTIEDRGKGKLDEFSAPNLKLIWISKSNPLLLLSSSKSGSDIASSSSYHSFDICGNASQHPPIIPPIVQTTIDEQLKVRSWKSTLPPLKLDETPRTQDVFEGLLPSFVKNQETQQVDNLDQSFDQHVTPHDVEKIVHEEQEVLREERTLTKCVQKTLQDSKLDAPLPQKTRAGTTFGKEQVDLACFSTLCDAYEPHSFEQALECVKWKDAMHQEIESIHKNHTWDLVDLPTCKKPIGTKWVFKEEVYVSQQSGFVVKGQEQKAILKMKLQRLKML